MSVLWGGLGVLGGLGMTAIGDMVSEEVRDRLDHLPQAILRLAARRLDPALRVTVYEDEWLPELTYILKGDSAGPITRLVHGTRYAVGIFTRTGRITQHLDPALGQVTATPPAVKMAVLQIFDPAAGQARLTLINPSDKSIKWLQVPVFGEIAAGPPF